LETFENNLATVMMNFVNNTHVNLQCAGFVRKLYRAGYVPAHPGTTRKRKVVE
jgi:hypothetical protein